MNTESDPIVRLTKFSQFFLEYGQLIGAWNSFEVMVEIVIMRELRLSVEESCIVNGALGFAAKVGIANAILNKTDEGKRKSAIINEAHKLAERNNFAHGIISVNDAGDLFTLVKREVKTKLVVHTKIMKSSDMQKHGHAFYVKFDEAMKICGVTDHDVIVYQREVESFAQAPQSPAAKRTPESPPSFRSANQERRHKLRAQRKAEKSQNKG